MRVGYRRSQRGGRGLGDALAEYAVIAVIIGGAVMGVRWYYTVYLHSPGYALQCFVSALNRGDTDVQYNLLSATTRQNLTSEAYTSKSATAGLTSRIEVFKIKDLKEIGSRATATVDMSVRRLGGPIYQAPSDPVEDQYVLVQDEGDWKVSLDECNLASFRPNGR